MEEAGVSVLHQILHYEIVDMLLHCAVTLVLVTGGITYLVNIQGLSDYETCPWM